METKQRISRVILGFSQERALDLGLNITDLAVLQWVLRFMRFSADVASDENEGDIAPIENRLHYITDETTGERYWKISMEYALSQLPVCSMKKVSTMSAVFSKLSGEFDGAKPDTVYPLKRILSSRKNSAGETGRHLYFRPTVCSHWLLHDSDELAEEALKKCRPTVKPQKAELFDDKRQLSESFWHLYKKIEAIYDFKHKLPVPGENPSKVLLEAQDQISAFLHGDFLKKNKYDPKQDVSAYDATEEAILAAVTAYARMVADGKAYKYSLASFFYNSRSGLSMVLSLLAQAKKTYSQPEEDADTVRKNSSKRVQKFLDDLEENCDLKVTTKAVNGAKEVVEWFKTNEDALVLLNNDAPVPLNEWADFKASYITWAQGWGEKFSQWHLDRTKGQWESFLMYASKENDWNLEYTAKDVEEKKKRVAETRKRLAEEIEARKRRVRPEDVIWDEEAEG